MKKIQVQAQVGRAEQDTAEVLVLLCCEGASDLSPEAAAINTQLGGQLAGLMQRGEFEGKLGEGLFRFGDRAVIDGALVNGSAYGLSAGVCSNRLDDIMRLVRTLQVGTVNGAFAALALALNGVATALLMPVLIRALRPLL